MEEEVVEPALRRIVPVDSVSPAGQEKGDANIRVGLRNINFFPAIIPHARLVLPESVERLVRAPNIGEEFQMMRRFTIHNHRRHGHFCLLEQSFACEILKRDAAVFTCDNRFDLRGAQHYALI